MSTALDRPTINTIDTADQRPRPFAAELINTDELPTTVATLAHVEPKLPRYVGD
jgi:hypothetical protein